MNEEGGGRKIVHNKLRIYTAAAWTFCLVVVVVVPYVDELCVVNISEWMQL